MLHTPTLLLALWACSIAYLDVRYRRIPNVLSLSAWICGFSLMLIGRSTFMGAPITSGLLAGGFALLVTVPGYVLRRLGAGDVKYLVGIGLLTSFRITLNCFLVAALSGGAVALLWLNLPRLARHMPDGLLKPPSALGAWMAVPLNERRMPYGALLTLGLIAALWAERGS